MPAQSRISATRVDDALADEVMKLRGGNATKIHTLTIGSTPLDALKKLADSTGGTALALSAKDLAAFAR